MLIHADKLHRHVTLRGATYPVSVTGSGQKDCLCIGIGSLMQRTLSQNFNKMFSVYSTDLYWTQQQRLADCTQLTMQQIIDDIRTVIKQLNLIKPIIVAHSAYGIVALEFAKEHGADIGGVIMVGSPPAWDDNVIAFARKYFDEHASLERKANDQARRDNFKLIKQPGESDISLNAYEADSARYWGDFNIKRTFLDDLWRGVEADDAIMNHFFCVILPKNDLAKNIVLIDIPVLLAAGRLDFDCVPLELWRHASQPSNFTIIDCGEVGHWPHLENSAMFDSEVERWIRELL